jgi:hypothetical protein
MGGRSAVAMTLRLFVHLSPPCRKVVPGGKSREEEGTNGKETLAMTSTFLSYSVHLNVMVYY